MERGAGRIREVNPGQAWLRYYGSLSSTMKTDGTTWSISESQRVIEGSSTHMVNVVLLVLGECIGVHSRPSGSGQTNHSRVRN